MSELKRRLLPFGRARPRSSRHPIRVHQPAASISPTPSRGVNVIGYLEAELGLGEIGRKIVGAAERSGTPTATVTFRRTHSRQEHRFEQRGTADAPYDTNVICVNADGLHLVRDAFGSVLFAGRYSIGVWFWELGYF